MLICFDRLCFVLILVKTASSRICVAIAPRSAAMLLQWLTRVCCASDAAVFCVGFAIFLFMPGQMTLHVSLQCYFPWSLLSSKYAKLNLK